MCGGKCRSAIHKGIILPIGAEPSGTGWTGFQSIGEAGQGYVLVYRESNEMPEASLKLYDLAGQRIVRKHICGHGGDFTATVDAAGVVRFKLPAAHTFALYHYRGN